MGVAAALLDFWEHREKLARRGTVSRFDRLERLAIEIFAEWLEEHWAEYEIRESSGDSQ